MSEKEKKDLQAGEPQAEDAKRFVYSKNTSVDALSKEEKDTVERSAAKGGDNAEKPARKDKAPAADEANAKDAKDAGADADSAEEAKKDGDKAEKSDKPAEKAPRPPKPPKSQEQLNWEAARRKEFKDRVWNPWLRPVVALVAVCLTVSLLLGCTNLITKPIIEENAAKAAFAAMNRLLPQADAFSDIAVPEEAANVTAIHKADNGTGYIIEAYGKGYGGNVPALVAFDGEGTIVGVEFLENGETKGLGEKLVSEDDFRSQFTGLPAQPVSITQLETIANATISSNAGLKAVNAAIEAFNQVAGGAGGGFEGTVKALLPDEELTAITLAAEGVQAMAWQSDAGNFVIVGEAESSLSTIVAAVAMDADGVILNLWVDTSGEYNGATVGNDSDYTSQFIGEKLPVGVDTIADLTGTTEAVNQAVDNALAALAAAKEAA